MTTMYSAPNRNDGDAGLAIEHQVSDPQLLTTKGLIGVKGTEGEGAIDERVSHSTTPTSALSPGRSHSSSPSNQSKETPSTSPSSSDKTGIHHSLKASRTSSEASGAGDANKTNNDNDKMSNNNNNNNTTTTGGGQQMTKAMEGQHEVPQMSKDMEEHPDIQTQYGPSMTIPTRNLTSINPSTAPRMTSMPSILTSAPKPPPSKKRKLAHVEEEPKVPKVPLIDFFEKSLFDKKLNQGSDIQSSLTNPDQEREEDILSQPEIFVVETPRPDVEEMRRTHHPLCPHLNKKPASECTECPVLFIRQLEHTCEKVPAGTGYYFD